MKKLADTKRTKISFDEGDWVLVKLQPYRQHSLVLRKKDKKLGMRYFGPFKVLKKIGAVAYRLQLLAEAHSHPIFHVSVLKKCNGD